MAARSKLVRTAVLATTLGAAAPASADIAKLYAEVHGGATTGTGLSGDQKAAAFFKRAAPATYGFVLGGRFLIANASLSHHQYARIGDAQNQSALSTWTQFDVGMAVAIDVGDSSQPASASSGADGQPAAKPAKERKGSYLELGVNVGFGVGTGEQVMPPLSNDEVTDKGFLVEGRIAFGKHLGKFFDAGVVVPISWGYFFKSGDGATANDLSTHYRGAQGSALIFLRANINLL